MGLSSLPVTRYIIGRRQWRPGKVRVTAGGAPLRKRGSGSDRDGTLVRHVVVERQAADEQNQYRGAGAAHANPRREAVHFADQLGLLLLHVFFGGVEEELVVLMHGEGAAVDPQYYQDQCKTAPSDKQCCHHRTPPWLDLERSRLLGAGLACRPGVGGTSMPQL